MSSPGCCGSAPTLGLTPPETAPPSPSRDAAQNRRDPDRRARSTLASMVATMDERLSETFVEMADTLVAGYDLMEFLQTLTERCVELLEVNAAGLLLADAGNALQLVAASTERARIIE